MSESISPPFEEKDATTENDNRHRKRLALQAQAARDLGYDEEADRLEQGKMVPDQIEGPHVFRSRGIITEVQEGHAPSAHDGIVEDNNQTH